jgi:hypothetical protein
MGLEIWAAIALVAVLARDGYRRFPSARISSVFSIALVSSLFTSFFVYLLRDLRPSDDAKFVPQACARPARRN